MPIIKNGRIQEDIWVSLTDREAETLDRNTPVLVSLEEWKAGRETLLEPPGRVAGDPGVPEIQ